MKEIEYKNTIKNILQDVFSESRIEIHIENCITNGTKDDLLINIVFGNKKISFYAEIVDNMNYMYVLDKIDMFKHRIHEEANFVPIIVSKYISPKLREHCKKFQVAYLDLSGNIYINFQDILIDRFGFKNKFPVKRTGRSPFSDKASLILRLLVREELRAWGIREIARELELTPGYVSKIVKELEKRNYVCNIDSGIRLLRGSSMLMDWVTEYSYKKNNMKEYYCLAKNPQDIIWKIKEMEFNDDNKYALTMQSGANQIYSYSSYASVHIYIDGQNTAESIIKKMNLKLVDRGGNVVLIEPYYKHSAWYDIQHYENIPIVSTLQLYLDLFNYPQRGREEAEHIYKKELAEKIGSLDDRQF